MRWQLSLVSHLRDKTLLNEAASPAENTDPPPHPQYIKILCMHNISGFILCMFYMRFVVSNMNY